MSDIHLQQNVEINFQSGRFQILSQDNIYRDFKGIAKGFSSEFLWEVDGFLYTKDHTFIINGKDVKASEIGIETNKKESIYDILHVQETHNYISNNKLQKNCLVLDEFGHVGNGGKGDLALEFVMSVFPTISSAKNKKNSKIIIISTPNGMNQFYQIYSKAQQKKNDFTAFKIDWQDIPRSVSPDQFRQNQVNTIGELGFAQEYACVGEDTLVTIKYDDQTKTVTLSELEELLNKE